MVVLVNYQSHILSNEMKQCIGEMSLIEQSMGSEGRRRCKTGDELTNGYMKFIFKIERFGLQKCVSSFGN